MFISYCCSYFHPCTSTVWHRSQNCRARPHLPLLLDWCWSKWATFAGVSRLPAPQQPVWDCVCPFSATFPFSSHIQQLFPSVSPGTLRTYDKFSFCNRDVTRLCHGPGGGTGSVMHMHAHMPENSHRNCKYKADWCFPLSGEYCAMNRQTRTANTRRHTHTHSCERETRFDVTWLLGNRSPWSWRFSIAANTAWKCVWLCSQYKRRFFVRDYSWFTLGRRDTITSSSTGGLADYSQLL